MTGHAPSAGREAVDLHLHSSASDGVLSPAALIALCAEAGVGLCALTDHDTVAGLAAARNAALDHGLQFIDGIELSCQWNGRALHVVGLGIDPAAAALGALLARLAEERAARAQRIAQRLDRAGAPGSEILAALAAEPVVTRTHFARELARRGHGKDPGAAFARWLARGQPGHTPGAWPELGATIGAIGAAGGIAVLAHPLRYTLSAGQRRGLVQQFAALGGTGIEVVVGGQNPAQTETALGLCLRAGLEASQGSDFHDPSLPWQRPGRLAKLPGSVVPVWQRWQADRVAAAPGAG